MLRKSAPILLLVTFLFPHQATAKNPKLSKRTIKLVKNVVVPAQHRGDLFKVVGTLSRLVGRLNDEQLRELDNILQSNGAPGAGELLAKSRLQLVLRNLQNRLPRPNLRELQVTLKAAKKLIDEDLEFARKQAVSKKNYGSKVRRLSEFERIFWSIHVLKNRIRNSRRFVKYGLGLIRQVKGTARRQLSDAEQILQRQSRELLAIRNRLRRRNAELRVARIELATNLVLCQS